MFKEDFGEIEFVKSTKARSINIRILATGLRITLPAKASRTEAIHFVNSVADKIKKKQLKLQNQKPLNQTVFEENTLFQTLTFGVKLQKATRKDIFFSLKNSILTIEFPEQIDIRSEKSQQYFWNGTNHFLKVEAKRIFPERVSQLAQKHNFKYSSVKIQPSKTRWGSCSQDKNINLSQYLLLLPPHLIDYVILHELCHTKEMNHGPNFWKLMDSVTNNESKNLRQQLKSYHIPK